MTEAMPFLQKYDITFLRPLPIQPGAITYGGIKRLRNSVFYDRVGEILTIAEEKSCGAYRTIAQKR